MLKNFLKNEKGSMIILALILPILFIFALIALSGWATSVKKAASVSQSKDTAFAIAEAGVNYYRWHLAHDPADYQDGTGAEGPYIHDYIDKDNVTVLGQFSLEIVPPPAGSTVVKIKSTGYILNKPNTKRVVRIQMGKPSIAKYAWAIGGNVVFGATSEIFGLIHVNGGVQFNGIAHNLVSSAKECYDDPDNNWAHTCNPSSGPNEEKPGVWGTGQFLGGTAVGVSALSFNSIVSDLDTIKQDANTAQGFYRGSSSPNLGYHIILKTNDTFDLRTVTSVVSQGSCTSPKWSIQNQTATVNYPFPSNGLMFFEDNIWIDGALDTARLTIASARFTANPSSVIINNDIAYTHTDGSEVLGIIAEKDVLVGLDSEDGLRIDAAVIAKSGMFGRLSYASTNCGASRSRNLLTTNGMIASFLRSGVYYGGSNGYQNRQYNYDGNLLYAHPPSFPLTSDEYEIISWEEIKN